LSPPELQSAPPPEEGSWVSLLRDDVEPTAYKKGRDYAGLQRVSALSRTGAVLQGSVAGSAGNPHVATLDTAARPLVSSCNCPAWNRYGPHCKHVVAVALAHLALERPAAPAASEPAMEAPSADVVPLPAVAKLESWLGLSSLPDHAFVYRIMPAHARSGGRAWLVDVRRREAQTAGPIQVKRLLGQGARLGPVDERALHELAHYESRYDGKYLLSDEELADLLEMLGGARVVYRGTPLVLSDTAALPQVHLESTDGGAKATLEFRLPEGEPVGLPEAVLLVGKRASHLLSGQTLYPVRPHLPARLWRKWLLEPSMSLPHGQLDRALTFFAAHLPRLDVSLRADGLEVEESTEPHFILTLEGNSERVKAQLGARYGGTTVGVTPSPGTLGYAIGSLGNKRRLYRRAEAGERAALKLLSGLGLRFDGEAYVAQGDVAVSFWAQGLKTLPVAWERFAAQLPEVKVRSGLKPRIRVGMEGLHWFELDARFEVDGQAVDLGAVRLWLASGRKYVPLQDGSFAEADREELERATELLEEAGAAPGKATTRIPLYQAMALDALASLGDAAEIEARARSAMAELRLVDQAAPVPPPAGLQATLRHYQEAGLAWLWFLHRHRLNGILADDMGLGKTLQALALLLKAQLEEKRAPSLVVAPTSVLANWKREAERFTPGLAVTLWHGHDRHTRGETFADVDIVLTSYALVRRDLEELSKTRWRYVVLDEAQNIKNAGSATAQACKALPAEHRLALTGTPLENRLGELWSIFDFLMPGFLGSEEDFSERYEQPIQVAADAGVRERLRRRIHPFILRRLKTEVAKDLPPKTEVVAWCEMDSGQAALYREVLEQSRSKVHESIDKVGFARARVSILAALMRLRQVCCDPRLLKLPPGTKLPPSAKLERFFGLVDDLVSEGHRALVFSQFTEMLDLLKAEADAKGLKYQALDGRTRDRMARVDAFNAPDGPPLFFISLKAGGTGLNLTAADYVLHFDPWWNPAVEDQATDRTHRIGQTRAVISYKLITQGTVEEKILQLQRRKRELAAGVLEGTAAGLQALSQADVEELFKDA
jgi:SNF2-related domain/Helicase conserved C-terminal domain/Bacterial SNF2 helicase associated/SWIM zinc finger